MKYIKKVILENFQSHKYSELEFDNYLNVIVGPSDHGKSAIIRGIKWALFNEPSGDFFIREGEKECSVTVIFNDNSKIKRYRSPSKNLYFYYDTEGNESIYQGFGNNVPYEIKEKINIRKIYLDTSETNLVNISEQLEGPFLLSESKAVRANAIGRLVGVHIIDDAIKDTVREINSLNSSKRSLLKVQDNLKADLKKYDYLDELKEDIEKLDNLLLLIKSKKEKIHKLKELNKSLKLVNEQIRNTSKIIDSLKNISDVEVCKDKLDYKIKSYSLVVNNSDELNKINKDIKYNTYIIEKLDNVEEVEAIYEKLNNNKDKFIILLDIYENYKRVKKHYNSNLKIVSKLKYIDKSKENIYRLEKLNEKILSLTKLKIHLDDSHKRIAFGNTYLEKLSKVNTADNLSKEITKLIDTKNSLLEIKEKYNKNLQNIRATENKIKQEKLNTESLLKEYKDLLSKMEICPLCFSKIDIDTIDNIIENYK